LGIAGLQAQAFDLRAQHVDLVFDSAPLGGGGKAFDGLAQVACAVFKGAGFVVECVGAIPMRFGFGHSLLAGLAEFVSPGSFFGDLAIRVVGFARGEVVGFGTPPGFDRRELLKLDGFGLGIALIARGVRVFVEPHGVGVEVLFAIAHHRALGEKVDRF